MSLIDPPDVPKGIGTISFTARLAQRIGFEDFCCYKKGTNNTNYAISAKAAMTNHRQPFYDGSTGSPSLSLVTYYRPGIGCYEFRITRIYAIYNNKDSDSPIIINTEFLNPQTPYAMHISAKENMAINNFSEAYKLLHEILYSFIEVPQPILYHVICDLEVCCKELGDYKSSYEYSLEKLSSLQKLLS